MFLEIFIFFIF